MACLKKGCLQLYCGDGKGKTTASVGLAVRAVGTGLKVLFCQVMKDGTSGEIVCHSDDRCRWLLWHGCGQWLAHLQEGPL